MSLPDFDTMVAMSTEELEALFDSEVEEILATCDPSRVARYRAMANGCKLRRQAAANPTASMVDAQQRMWESFSKLNNLLQETIGNS